MISGKSRKGMKWNDYFILFFQISWVHYHIFGENEMKDEKKILIIFSKKLRGKVLTYIFIFLAKKLLGQSFLKKLFKNKYLRKISSKKVFFFWNNFLEKSSRKNTFGEKFFSKKNFGFWEKISRKKLKEKFLENREKISREKNLEKIFEKKFPRNLE